MKHQANCYRVINGIKMSNWADLLCDDYTNKKTIETAKLIYKFVRKIKHPSGYYQLFVSIGIKN